MGLLLLAGAAAAGKAQVGAEAEASVSPARLLTNFYRQDDRQLTVLGATSHLRQAVLGSSLGSLSRARFATEVVGDDPSLGSSALLLPGTPGSNPWFRRLAPKLPIEVKERSFTFLKESYDDPADALYFLYPNPFNPTLPLFVVIGNAEGRAADLLGRLPLNQSHYAVYRGDRRLRFGRFVAEGPEWAVDTAEDRSFASEITLEETSPHFRFVVHRGAIDAPRLRELSRRKEASYERVQRFLGRRLPPGRRIGYYLYGRCSEKGLFTGDTRISHADPDRLEVHLALEEGFEGDAWDHENLLLLRAALGEPRVRALELGLGVLLSENWRKRGWAYWAARLFQAGQLLPIEELLDNELLDPAVYDHASDPKTRAYPLRASPLVAEPSAASLVAHLLKKWGTETFLLRYRSWEPPPAEVQALAAALRAEVGALAEGQAEAVTRERSRFPATSTFRRGANHTFEGFTVSSGYLSPRSDDSLRRLRGLGANAVAIVPYTYFLRRDGRPSPLPWMRGPGKENDESVIHAGLLARRLGMSVLLKPQLQGIWPGDIVMGSKEDWSVFLGHYERWIRHYALIAELYHFEALSLGVEMVHATTENEGWWRGMASRIRKLYSGRLVYSANWGSELEKLSFWEAFDYIGADTYYPLSDKIDASDEELLAGARSALERLEAVHRRYGRPVLLTEVGFSSGRAPWREPWKDGSRESRPEDQARAFEAVFRALEGEEWCHGLFWWKWPSRLQSLPGDTSHSIGGKPAAGVMAKWFSRLGAQR